MAAVGTHTPDLLDLPDELSAKARAVPGLPERLVRFIKLEVELNERRQERYTPETLELVKRAREQVEKRKAQGIDRAEAIKGFQENFSEIIRAL